GAFAARESDWPRAPLVFWVAGTGIALIGGVAILRNLLSATVALYNPVRSHAPGWVPWQLALLLSFSAICFLPLPLSGFGQFGAYDRHILILIPVVIGILAGIPRQSVTTLQSTMWRRTGIVLLIVYSLFSIAAAHDYLAWNRTRWTVLQGLINKAKIPI